MGKYAQTKYLEFNKRFVVFVEPTVLLVRTLTNKISQVDEQVGFGCDHVRRLGSEKRRRLVPTRLTAASGSAQQ